MTIEEIEAALAANLAAIDAERAALHARGVELRRMRSDLIEDARKAKCRVMERTLSHCDMTTITPADWTVLVRAEWEHPDGQGCGRLYRLAYMARDYGRHDCVDIVAFKLFAEAATGGVATKDGVPHDTTIAPAVGLLLLLRGDVVADRDRWLERIRREWSAETKANPRVQREAVCYMDVTL